MFFTYLRRELRRRRKAALVVASGLALGIALVDVLERLWKEHGLTFVVVTHDSAIAKKAPRLATIRKGKISVRENAGA
jgi:predicted ABC-type transport system involved in lysophospholipase L1 biosynthesis ATPase subunit